MILGRFFPIAILIGSFAATGVGFVAGAGMGLLFGLAGLFDPLAGDVAPTEDTAFLAGTLLALAFGAFVGGRLTAGHSPGDETFNAGATGVLLFAGSFVDFGDLQLPLWFKLASGFVSLTFVLLGSQLYMRRFATA